MVAITQSRIDELVRVFTFGEYKNEIEYVKNNSYSNIGKFRKYILDNYLLLDEKFIFFEYNVGEIQILEAQKL
jgi:hypothetical protein